MRIRRWILAARAASLACALASCVIMPVPPEPPEPSTPDKVVMGYYASWTRAELDHTEVAYEYLTHIAHAFAWPDPSGNLVVPPGFLYPALNAAARQSGVKMILSLGGWGNCAGFPGMVSTAESRARFIVRVVGFCEANGYDGVDIDWEFAANDEEKADFVLFVEALGAALRARTPALLLTMAAPAENYHGRWIDFERLADDFDLIGFMTYGYHGAWSGHSGPNAPLYPSGGDACGSVDETFAYAVGRGVPAGKILIGLPFFGKSFDCGGWGLPFTAARSLTYADIMALPPADWARTWDDVARVPSLRRRDGRMVISFDDVISVGLKCQYAKDKRSAGVIVWELGGDDRSGNPRLLEVVGRSFGAR